MVGFGNFRVFLVRATMSLVFFHKIYVCDVSTHCVTSENLNVVREQVQISGGARMR